MIFCSRHRSLVPGYANQPKGIGGPERPAGHRFKCAMIEKTPTAGRGCCSKRLQSLVISTDSWAQKRVCSGRTDDLARCASPRRGLDIWCGPRSRLAHLIVRLGGFFALLAVSVSNLHKYFGAGGGSVPPAQRPARTAIRRDKQLF
jgi:hypothetical protein